MAIIVEVQQIADDLYRVASHQLVESEDSPDFAALQQVVDESAAEDFQRMETRDLIRVLLQRTPLERQEQRIINLFLKGFSLAEIADELGVTRQTINNGFWRVVKKLRRMAQVLNISP